MNEALISSTPTVLDGVSLNYLVYIAICVVGAMASAVIWLYKDNKEDRQKYSDRLESIIQRSEESREKNSLALHGLTKAIEELRSDMRQQRLH